MAKTPDPVQEFAQDSAQEPVQDQVQNLERVETPVADKAQGQEQDQAQAQAQIRDEAAGEEDVESCASEPRVGRARARLRMVLAVLCALALVAALVLALFPLFGDRQDPAPELSAHKKAPETSMNKPLTVDDRELEILARLGLEPEKPAQDTGSVRESGSEPAMDMATDAVLDPVLDPVPDLTRAPGAAEQGAREKDTGQPQASGMPGTQKAPQGAHLPDGDSSSGEPGASREAGKAEPAPEPESAAQESDPALVTLRELASELAAVRASLASLGTVLGSVDERTLRALEGMNALSAAVQRLHKDLEKSLAGRKMSSPRARSDASARSRAQKPSARPARASTTSSTTSATTSSTTSAAASAGWRVQGLHEDFAILRDNLGRDWKVRKGSRVEGLTIHAIDYAKGRVKTSGGDLVWRR